MVSLMNLNRTAVAVNFIPAILLSSFGDIASSQPFTFGDVFAPPGFVSDRSTSGVGIVVLQTELAAINRGATVTDPIGLRLLRDSGGLNLESLVSITLNEESPILAIAPEGFDQLGAGLIATAAASFNIRITFDQTIDSYRILAGFAGSFVTEFSRAGSGTARVQGFATVIGQDSVRIPFRFSEEPPFLVNPDPVLIDPGNSETPALRGFLGTVNFPSLRGPVEFSASIQLGSRDFGAPGSFSAATLDVIGLSIAPIPGPTVIPEPTSVLLLVTGLSGLALLRKRLR